MFEAIKCCLPRPESSVLKRTLNNNHVMDQGTLHSLSLDSRESSGSGYLLWIVCQSWSPGKSRISKCPTSWCTKINIRLCSWVYIYSDQPLPSVRLDTFTYILISCHLFIHVIQDLFILNASLVSLKSCLCVCFGKPSEGRVKCSYIEKESIPTVWTVSMIFVIIGVFKLS